MYARALIQRSIRLLKSLAPVLVLTACERETLPTAVPPTHATLDAVPGTCVVTTTGDAGAGSLREKIDDLTCSTITFELTYPATILLTSGQLTIAHDLTIEGPGADKLAVARSSALGTPQFRVFFNSDDVTATISGVTITNGRPADFVGGGVSNQGTLTVALSTITGNFAMSQGGGLYNRGNLTISRSTVANNVSHRQGGGVYNGGTVTISQSTISGNTAEGAGAGPRAGGGVLNGWPGTMTISHSTIVANAAPLAGSQGGGIFNDGALTIRGSVVAGNSAPVFGAPEISHANVDFRSSLTVVRTLVGSPTGNAVTATPENGNLVGTAESPLDPKVDGLALNAPGTTPTHALRQDSPAIDAVVCTDDQGNSATIDQRGVARPQGLTCDMGAYELGPSSISTTTALSISPSTQQYSDGITLSASITPASATGLVEFFRLYDTGWESLGLVVVKDGAARLRVNVPEPAGTASYKAEFTGTGYTTSTANADHTVTREDATIGYSSNNVAALQVSSAGGALNAGLLTLAFTVKEKEPDIPVSPGTNGAGEIKNAGLAVTLAPVGSGSSVVLTCTGGFASGLGYATRTFSCTNAGPISVNTYEVQASVTGDYYTGTYSDAFTVFDPSLGFATGGGSFTLGGDKVNFGFTMKYNKGGTNLQGNFIAVRHQLDGTVSRLKSNALGGLAIGEDANVPMGWASFTGKANYTTWDGAANAGAGAYVTVGNQPFAVYAEDRDNPGQGPDVIWLGGVGKLAMDGTLATAKSKTAALTGGGVAVPHKAGKK